MNDYWVKLSHLKREIENKISEMQNDANLSHSEKSLPQDQIESLLKAKLKNLHSTKPEISAKWENLIMNIKDYKSTLSESSLQGVSGRKLVNFENDTKMLKQKLDKNYRVIEYQIRDEQAKINLFGNQQEFIDDSSDGNNMECLVREREEIDRGHRSVSTSLEHGREVLESLDRQTGQLQNVGRRMRGIFNDLGLTNTTIRMTHQRARGDELLVLGLLVITLLIMVVCYFWLRHWVRDFIWGFFGSQKL